MHALRKCRTDIGEPGLKEIRSHLMHLAKLFARGEHAVVLRRGGLRAATRRGRAWRPRASRRRAWCTTVTVDAVRDREGKPTPMSLS